MNAQTTQFDDLRLIALPTAVNCADLFVRFALTEWALPRLADDAKQVACELVSAAVASADPKAPGFITVRLQLRGDRLVIEVEDEQPVRPTAIPSTLTGLESGVEPLTSGGALLWCELPLPAGMTASSVPLPRRERRKSQAANQPVNHDDEEFDPQVFERILSQLNRGPDHRAE